MDNIPFLRSKILPIQAGLLFGMRLEQFAKFVTRNRIPLYPKNILFLCFMVPSCWWSSFFARIEERCYGKTIETIALPEDPIIIIGHFRSGTTFLHQLLSIDPGFTAPTFLHMGFPDNFLLTRPFVEPFLKFTNKMTRPMDQVKLGIHEPQEDECALFRMTTISPLERLFFPKSSDYFLLDYDTYEPDEAETYTWEKAMSIFCKKLFYTSGKQILLKNPFHSMRIKTLSRLFPRACFVHIYRHPYAVVPSTIHTWSIIGEMACLNKKWAVPKLTDVATVMDRTVSSIRLESVKLPRNRYFEVRYEDLEKDPIKILKDMYKCFGRDFTPIHEEKVSNFFCSTKTYQKNKFKLSHSDREQIYDKLKNHFKYYNYRSSD